MKKLILCGSALLLSLVFAKAQTPGVTATSAYDDFAGTGYTAADALGIYWWNGPVGTGVRSGGKYTNTFSNASSFYVVDFGTNNTTTPATPLVLNLSTMADIELVVENNSSQLLNMYVYLEAVGGVFSDYEPNISDCVGVPNTSTPTPGITVPAGEPGTTGDVVYPKKARNGFALKAGVRDTFRLDLSSVTGVVGGLTRQNPWVGTTPDNSPSTLYSINPANIHAVQFLFNNGEDVVLSGNAVDKGSYRYDTTVLAANNGNYTGAIIFHSFKIGSVLTALPADPTTGVNEAIISNSLKVYPNPAKEALTVSFETANGAEVTISDIAGYQVYSASANAGANNITVNTSGLSAGMYILNVATENGRVARKVTIQ